MASIIDIQGLKIEEEILPVKFYIETRKSLPKDDMIKKFKEDNQNHQQSPLFSKGLKLFEKILDTITATNVSGQISY